MQSLLTLIQQRSVQYKKQIIALFVLCEVLMVVMWIGGAMIYSQSSPLIPWLYVIGKKMGVLSFFLYVGSLIPGLLKRFQVLAPLQVSLMLFRRHIGILMFLSAIVHLGYLKTFSIIFPDEFTVLSVETFELFGFVALGVLFPLWLTSNDLAVRTIKRRWNLLHKLTYVACAFIFLHVAFTEVKLAVIAGVVILFEIASWVKIIKVRRMENEGQRTEKQVYST